VERARRLQITVSGADHGFRRRSRFPVRKSLNLLVLAVLAAGCHLDKLLSDGSGGGAPPHGTGVLKAAATTSGSNFPTGYTVVLDSSQGTPIGVNDSITATGIAAGSHRAALDGVPANCSVSGANPRSVSVLPNDTARTAFSVACTPPATQLAFTIPPPSQVTVLSDTFQVEVTAEDASGNIVPGYLGQVTIGIGTDGSLTHNAHLRGTTSAKLVNGIATFPNLSIDQPGVNYTLKASVVPTLPDATSRPFNVLVP
jgi:hypothetical protein